MKLHKKIKKKWTTALRSGKYHQTKDNLVKFKVDGMTPKGFCCLGVLCDINGANLEDIAGFGLATDTSCSLPGNTKEVLASNTPRTAKRNTDVEGYLTALNDEYRWDFKRIADWIDRNL